jgi:uncharacterized protein
MLILLLAAVERGDERVRGEIPTDDAFWEGTGIALLEPLAVEASARYVAPGVYVRAHLRTRLALECRRCLTAVEWPIDETVELLYEQLSQEEFDQMEGDVYPLDLHAAELDLTEALREQLMLRVPQYVVCDEACRGLCPQCGANLNETECGCTPAEEPGPWDALKKIRFD